MNKYTKKSLSSIEISGIRRFNQLASKYTNVVKLTIGELDVHTPPNVKEKAIQAILNNQTRYTSNAGLDSLRSSLSKKYLMFDKDEFILTVGTTEGLSTVIKSIIEPNDEVIIPTPGYVGYEPLILLEGGRVNTLDTVKDNFTITKSALEKAYTPNVKALIITNPNNPTGGVLSETEMDIIGSFVLEHDILLIADEIYGDLAEDFISFSSYIELKNQLILLNGFSKSHAMTGFRIGYVAATKELIDEFLKVHQYSVTSAASISQFAALEAIKKPYDGLLDKLKKRREYLLDELTKLELPVAPAKGAFYLFVDISKHQMSSETFCKELLHKQQLALIPGEYFLGNHKAYVRISYAADMGTLQEAIKRLKAFLN